ncbi:MAG: hypothetical protein AAB966_02880 [Patescibacteria group bacterium]
MRIKTPIKYLVLFVSIVLILLVIKNQKKNVENVKTSTSTGETIIFDSKRNAQNFEIYIRSPGETQPKQITNNSSYDSWWAKISPDKIRVLFYRTPVGIHDRDYSQTSLWMMNIDGSNQRMLLPQHAFGWDLHGHAEWSPDGSMLIMFGGKKLSPQIFITDNEGKNPKQLTYRPGQNLDPSWSPDGKSITFVACLNAICFPSDYEIFTMDNNGQNQMRITDDKLRDHDPYYSPDGQTIAWITKTSNKNIIGVWNIRSKNINTQIIANVTNDDAINSKPDWSPDGSRIYFHRLTPGKNRFNIFSVRPDGTELQEIFSDQYNNEYPQAE